MKKDNKGREINKGDRVSIQSASGLTVTGIVTGADWWGEESGWYIELIEANVPGGYSYYKQEFDGGDVSEINGVYCKDGIMGVYDFVKNLDGGWITNNKVVRELLAQNKQIEKVNKGRHNGRWSFALYMVGRANPMLIRWMKTAQKYKLTV